MGASAARPPDSLTSVPMPSVSVIVPVRNGEEFVADAIESVLDQADVSAELIVVDDGSTDGTAQVLGRFAGRITVDELERTWCVGRPQSRHGACAGRAARVSRRGRPAASALPGAFPGRGRRRSRGGRLPLRLARSRLRRRTCPLRTRSAVRPGLGPVPRARRCGFAAHLGARRTSHSYDTPWSSSTRTRACRRTGTTGSGWRLPERPFAVCRETWRSSDAAA